MKVERSDFFALVASLAAVLVLGAVVLLTGCKDAGSSSESSPSPRESEKSPGKESGTSQQLGYQGWLLSVEIPVQGVSPVEAEQLVAPAVEQALQAAGAQRFQLVLEEGLVRVQAPFETEGLAAAAQAKLNVEQLQSKLPEQAELPLVRLLPPEAEQAWLLVGPQFASEQVRHGSVTHCDGRLEVRLAPAIMSRFGLEPDALASLLSSRVDLPVGGIGSSGGKVLVVRGQEQDPFEVLGQVEVKPGLQLRDVAELAMQYGSSTCHCVGGQEEHCRMVRTGLEEAGALSTKDGSIGLIGKDLTAIGIRTTPRGEQEPRLLARALSEKLGAEVWVFATAGDGSEWPELTELGASRVVLVDAAADTGVLRESQPGLVTFVVPTPGETRHAVVFTGSERTQLRKAASGFRRTLRSDGRWIGVDAEKSHDEFAVKMDEDRASALGISVNDIAARLRLALVGVRVADLTDKGQPLEVWLRIGEPPDGHGHGMEWLRDVTVRTVEGDEVPVNAVARVNTTTVKKPLWRLNGERAVVVWVLQKPGGDPVKNGALQAILEEAAPAVSARVERW